MRHFVLFLLLFAACKCKPTPSPVEETASTGEDVKPAFEGTPKQFDQKAKELCEVLHRLPAVRRAACCDSTPRADFSEECSRVLSLALEQKTVALSGQDVCARELAAAYQGCDWVGPTDLELPPSCRSVVKGKLAKGVKCRSTLECVSGLRCVGAGPTSVGVCTSPGETGTACELAVDVLVSYVRQTLPPHSECSGFCQRHRCESVLSDGGTCTLNEQCGKNQRCAGTCVEGAQGTEGEACVSGGCVFPLRCISGKCAAPKPSGEPCTLDIECLGACRQHDAGKTCGLGC